MNWRAMAIFSWALAISLAFWIMRGQVDPPVTQIAVADAVPTLLLVPAVRSLAPSPAEPVTNQTPLTPLSVDERSGQACVRLGKFPTRAWAQRVADVLALPSTEEVTATAFRLRGADDSGYFIVFPAWSLDQLARRLADKAPALKRWVSASARPEPCQPAERQTGL